MSVKANICVCLKSGEVGYLLSSQYTFVCFKYPVHKHLIWDSDQV